MSQEECIQDFQDRYRQDMLDHFAENEETFNRLVDTLTSYIDNVDDIDMYRSMSLSHNRDQNDYRLFTAREPDQDGDDIVRVFIDFINDSTVNIYDITEEELDMILEGEGFDRNSGLPRYEKVIIIDSMSNSEDPGKIITFSFGQMGFYNKADRVEASLHYIRDGESQDFPDKINDHWFITYSVYWAPAL